MKDWWYTKRIFPKFFWKIGLKNVKTFFWERHLADEIPKVETKIPVKIRLASLSDFKRSPLFNNEALKRLSAGDLCFIAVCNGIIAGHLWATFKRKVYVREIEREVTLQKGEVYLYNGLILPGFRRKGLLKKLLEETLRYFKSRNVKKAKAGALISNKASRRALRALGFRIFRFVKFVKIFRFKRFEERELKSYGKL